MQSVVIPFNYFEPYGYQKEVFAALEKGTKRIMLVWGRQKGKDTTTFCAMVMQALKTPGNYFYIFPTKEEARKAVWEKIDHDGKALLSVVPPEVVARRSDMEMMFRLKANGGTSTIRFVGLDHKPDSIRGITPAGIAFSEFAYQDPRAAQAIMPAARRNKNCWIIYNSTPQGRNHFFDMYHGVKDDPNWFVSVKQSLFPDKPGFIGPAMSDKEIDDIKRTEGYDDELIAQEYGCAFDIGMQGAIYADLYNESRVRKQIGDYPPNPELWVDTFWDIGYKPDPTSIWFRQLQGGREVMVKYWEGTGMDVRDILRQVLEETDFAFRTHYLPWDGDNNRPGTHFSFKDLLEQELSQSRLDYPGDVRCTPKIAKADGIHWVRARWSGIWWNESECLVGLDHLEQYHKKYDAKRKVYVNEPHHDNHSHAADALRTMVSVDRFERAPHEGEIKVYTEFDVFKG